MCEQNKELKRHKHYDVLIAIAEGREFQIYSEHAGQWQDWNPSLKDPINFPNEKYRVKPKIVRKYHYAYGSGRSIHVTAYRYKDDEDFVSNGYSNADWFQRLDNSCVESEEV